MSHCSSTIYWKKSILHLLFLYTHHAIYYHTWPNWQDFCMLFTFRVSFNPWFISLRTQWGPHTAFSHVFESLILWLPLSHLCLWATSLLRKPGHLSWRWFCGLDSAAASAWHNLICSTALCISWLLAISSRGSFWSQFTFWGRALPRWCCLLPVKPIRRLETSSRSVLGMSWLWVHLCSLSNSPSAFHVVVLSFIDDPYLHPLFVLGTVKWSF